MLLPLNSVVLTGKGLKPWSLQEGRYVLCPSQKGPSRRRLNKFLLSEFRYALRSKNLQSGRTFVLFLSPSPPPAEKADWNRKHVIVYTHRVWVLDVVGVVLKQQPWHISWCSLIEGSISLQDYKYRPTGSHSLLHIPVLDLTLDIHLVYCLK